MASLTCRHWLLDPNGCTNSRCPYSHTLTGIISPPSPFACEAFNNGSCPLTQDLCLYAHLDAVKNPHFLFFLHPHLPSLDVPIAEAAAKSGFDCSDWNSLKRLIDSVKGAVQSTYPDKYTGQAALKSRAQHRLRPNTYRPQYDLSQYIKRDGSSVSTEGSFHSAQTFLPEPRPRLHSGGSRPIPYNPSATGENRVPLGPKSMNARIVPAARKRNAQSSLKTSRPAAKRTRVDWDAPCVDQANAAPDTLKYSDPTEDPREQLPTQLPRDDLCRSRTHQVLTKCTSKLHAAVTGIQTDRNRLSQRWEADDALRSQAVTDAMAELNSHFFEAETNLQAAISVVEDKLLGGDGL